MSILVAEVVGGLLAPSLVLLADAAHMTADAAGIGLSLLAVYWAGKPKTATRTFGYERAEILAAVLSAHVVVDDSCWADGTAPQVLDRLGACLSGHFDLEHSTFQLEHQTHADHEAVLHG